MNRFSLSTCLTLATALVLSACAMKETPQPMSLVSDSLPAASPVPPSLPTAPDPTLPPIGSVDPGDLRSDVSASVLFALDQSSLDERAKTILKGQAEWLQTYRVVTVTLEGHCDERGTREYNLALGARRAAAVKDYLVSLGVAADRLKTVSFGKERPVCEQSNEACWTQNRRSVSLVADTPSSRSIGMRF